MIYEIWFHDLINGTERSVYESCTEQEAKNRVNEGNQYWKYTYYWYVPVFESKNKVEL